MNQKNGRYPFSGLCVLALFVALAGVAHAQSGGVFAAMEPEITALDIFIHDPKELRADQSLSRTDLMPKVVAQMSVTGLEDLNPSEIEYSYRIRRVSWSCHVSLGCLDGEWGFWSYWERGPQLAIDSLYLATEAKYDVRIFARVPAYVYPPTILAGYAEFSFVNDYTAPTVTLEMVGPLVAVPAKDNVYTKEELTMQYRLNGGAWTQPGPIQNIDILPLLMQGAVTVDVIVADPSGNTRSVRQTFDETAEPDRVAGANATQETDDGCSISQGNSGLVTVLALLALVFLRRREGGMADLNVG